MADNRIGFGVLAAAMIAAACTGSIVDPPTSAERGGSSGSSSSGSWPEGSAPPPSTQSEALVPKSGARRLTAAEYDATLADLLGETNVRSELLLPEDVRTPYDNDSTDQVASQALIEGAEMLAVEAAARLVADPVRRSSLVGCSPAGAGDSQCFRSFLEKFGRRALRRPLAEAELDGYVALQEFAVEAGDFYVGVETALRAFLQDPEFLYRVEVGVPVEDKPGMFRLTPFEMATRLAYFLWGSTPSDALLDLAQGGKLASAQDVRAAAASLLADVRARKRIARFHAMWLGYETLPHSAELARAMKLESDALVERVIFDEQAAWQEILRAEETYIDDNLAAHYGLPAPGSSAPAWVNTSSGGRRGILSHGSFLSNGAKFDDTSPTLRGLAVRTRLFCQTIPDPPPSVATDDPIPKTEDALCKKQRYAIHSTGGCADCHQHMDPVGFGLENYDQLGRYRAVEPDEPSCAIDGVGELVGVGSFKGPAELANLAIESGQLNPCVVTQLYRFAMGRFRLDETDEKFIAMIADKLGSGDFRFDQLVLDFVSSEAFFYRREE
jgi:hypothetical protein